MRVADYIADFLDAQGVELVFELVGGMITHLVDAIHCRDRVRLISMHHEQAAAFAADAAGRMTGVPGVAMATSGPGATNLLTGIGSCYFDSTPAVFLTGQVNREERRGNRPIRQLGFQETDIVAVARPLTKATFAIDDPAEAPSVFARAFSTALSGRPGPVLIDIPMDVQRAEIGSPAIEKVQPERAPMPDLAGIRDMFDALAHAERPLILAGGGARGARASRLIQQFANALRVPVVNSLLAVDVLPASDPMRVGMIGSYGNRWANTALGRADFLLVLGSRLDIRQTGADTASFKGDRPIFHIDCDEGELNGRVEGCRTMVADVRHYLEAALSLLRSQPLTNRTAWHQEISELKDSWPDTWELRDVPGINPNLFMHQLSRVSTRASAYVVDVGQHQMWAAQSLDLAARQRFLTSGGMGSMGFGLPAAIGAALTRQSDPIVLIAGDGGMQVNIQELQTVTRNSLPIKMVVINNGCHGMVRQFQQTYFEERYQSTYWGYSAPNFAAVASAYGIRAHRVERPADVELALEWLWTDLESPALLEVAVDTFANAYPKLAFGLPLTEMEPLARPLAMEST